MRLVLHREIPEDAALQRQWNELVQRMECPEIFYTYEWALAMSRAYHASLTPLLLMRYEQDALVGVASLALDNLHKKVFFLAATTADYCDFVSLPEHRARFTHLVFEELQQLKLPSVVLANLPEDSTTGHALVSAAPGHGYSAFSRPAYLCAQVRFSAPHERISAKKSLLEKRKLHRRMKALCASDPVRVRHLKCWNEVAGALPHFQQAHISRFSATGRISNLTNPERQAFLVELAKLLSRSNSMALTCLTVGDEPAAWNYGFQFAGSWFWYQPAFDVRYERYDPGLCLLTKIIEEACDKPEINRVDLGLGTEGYKARFATHSRRTLHITMNASVAQHWKTAARYHATSAIKSSPLLEHWARRLLRERQPGVPQA